MTGPEDAEIRIAVNPGLTRLSRYIDLFNDRRPIISHRWLEALLMDPDVGMDAFRIQVPTTPDPKLKLHPLLNPVRETPSPSTVYRPGDPEPVSPSVSAQRRKRGRSTVDDDSDNSDGDKGKRTHVYKEPKYACQRATFLEARCEENQRLVEELDLIKHAREAENDDKSALAYQKAIAAIKAYPTPIKSHQEARRLPGIGESMEQKIKEFLRVGYITEAVRLFDDERIQIIQMFQRIYDAGPKKARAWYEKGYRSIEDIMDSNDVTMAQRKWLSLYDDLCLKLSRSDVEEIADAVRQEAAKIDPDITLEIVGGYRRGKPESGDVDVLLTHPDRNVTATLLETLVTRLQKAGHVEAVLHQAHKDRIHWQTLIIRQPSTRICRQVDVVVTSQESCTSILPAVIILSQFRCICIAGLDRVSTIREVHSKVCN